jgi:hypothetical protein
MTAVDGREIAACWTFRRPPSCGTAYARTSCQVATASGLVNVVTDAAASPITVVLNWTAIEEVIPPQA